nr:unnamed protein product [Haemonchus contortus]
MAQNHSIQRRKHGSNMRFVLVTIIVALCIGISLSQMTFSDHWSKKSLPGPAFPRYKPRESESSSQQKPAQQQQFCQEEKVTDALAQLAQLGEAQNMLTSYLNTCYQSRPRV